MTLLNIAAALIFAWSCAAQPAPDAEIDADLKELTAITGLKIHHPVAYDLVSRDKINQFLNDRLKEAVTPEELRAEELTLKKFGFVPRDFDLAKTTIDLLTEQAAALYDYHSKKLYIMNWTSSALRKEALVHELAHALADQNFHLERFIKKARNNDDSSTARLAVMEGQASWLMAEVDARAMGNTLRGHRQMAEMLSGSMDSASGFPIFEKAPLYIQITLLFPYSQGILFQNSVIERNGPAGFSQVFRHPPVSTQQILHPQKYFAGVTPVPPPLPKPRLPRGYKTLVEGAIGELDHSILLRQYATNQQAGAIAPFWKAGSYSLLENTVEKRTVLLYASEWESVTVARSFFELYEQVLRKKWNKMEVSTRDEHTLAGQGDDGYFLVRLVGPIMTSVEGLPSAEAYPPL